ncbi:MAG: S9 family peptidase, partial [Acidimicrobiia bacterium]|nr:S9 family peptidase [Acidimicrobiia bacterium]
VWTLPTGGSPTQLTVDRPPAGYWEDTAPAVSPEWLAYAGPGGVRIVPAAGGPSKLLVAGAGSPVWMPDGRLIVLVSQERALSNATHPRATEVGRLAMVDPKDPWPAPFTPADTDPAQAEPSPDARFVAYSSFPPDDRNRSDIVVADLTTGELRTLVGEPGMHAHSPAWSPDGSTIAYVSESPGWYQVFLVDVATGSTTQLTDETSDFGAPRWSPDGTRLLGTRSARGRSDIVTIQIDTGDVSVHASGGEWQDPHWFGDDSILAIFEDHATPPRIERIDGTGRRVLFDPAPAPVRTVSHVSPSEVTYTSVDGLEIHGFLFKPTGASASTPVPAVVYPHGGPTSAYTDAWDGHAQYFIDKGYAWFAINFRGSTTYGREFERANHGVWGIADTEDCLAAADFLAGLDWVAGDRIAIFGASYGSYMALTSLTYDPQNRFACGVAKYGDCDILTSWAQGDRVGTEDLERQMGHPADAARAYRAGSPIHRIDEIERPILVAHGEKDDRVHPKQSEELVRALSQAGKTYEYVTYPTEGHGFLRTEPQLHFYRRLERFLDWYLM